MKLQSINTHKNHIHLMKAKGRNSVKFMILFKTCISKVFIDYHSSIDAFITYNQKNCIREVRVHFTCY